MAAVAAIRVRTQACTVHARVCTEAVVAYQVVGVVPRHIIRMVIAMIMANINLIISSSSSSSSRAAPVATPPHPHAQLLRHLLLAAHRAAALRATIIATAATTINCNCSSSSSRLLPYQAIIIRIIIRRITITLCLASSLIIMATPTLLMATLKHLLFLVPQQTQLAAMRMPHPAMAIPVVTAAAVPQRMLAAIIVHMLVPTRAAMTMA